MVQQEKVTHFVIVNTQGSVTYWQNDICEKRAAREERRLNMFNHGSIIKYHRCQFGAIMERMVTESCD
jgi:hypothetical protein